MFTNRLCLEYGLSLNRKGYHFDGTPMEERHIQAWSKEKYNFLAKHPQESYVIQCADVVKEVMLKADSRDAFVSGMAEYGWKVFWNNEKKNIVFKDENGNKVSNTNLKKTFLMDVSVDALESEFKKRQKMCKKGYKSKGQQQQEEMENYYKKVEKVEFFEKEEER